MSNSLTADIVKALKPHPSINLIITAGNSFRSDDGVGTYLAAHLNSSGRLKIIDAKDTPENIVDQAIKLNPDNIVVIDAADFGGYPGEAKIISQENISEVTLSTHMIPLNVVIKIITKDTKSEVAFIGIQPKTISFGEGLSDEVKKTADVIIETIKSSYF